MLDLPAKQHIDNACSQPTCGRKIRGKFNAKHVYTQTHHPSSPTPTPYTYRKLFLKITFIYRHCMHRTEEHLMLVTQERSLYRNEVERSRKAVHVHFGQEGVFVYTYILQIGKLYTRLTLHSRCITPATRCSPAQSISLHLGRSPSLAFAVKLSHGK